MQTEIENQVIFIELNESYKKIYKKIQDLKKMNRNKVVFFVI